jgi:hypothetical protein
MIAGDRMTESATARRVSRRRLVGVCTTVAMLVLLSVAWLITGPMRTADRLAPTVGLRWILSQVSNDSRSAAVARRGDHTLTLRSDGLVLISDGCNTTTGQWSWTLRGFAIDDAANGLIACGYAPGTEPPPTDPLVTTGTDALYGSVSAQLDGPVLRLTSNGYT